MTKTDRAVVKLLFDILSGKTGEISRVDYKPQKPEFDPSVPIEQPFPRSTPEAEGVPSRFVYDFLSDLANTKNAYLHHFMMLRHGKVICETSIAPYRNGDWHITHSMCKSFTGMAIGLLIDDGLLSLDDKVVDIFDSRVSVLSRFRMRDITIRHLLTMTSGVDFSEPGALSGNDWIDSFLNASLKFTPGTQFAYNSMNSYMLSAIVTEKTGLTMADFLKERIFKPLGITEVFWEASPEGITKGGWGLFIRPEDAAKLGMLYLNGGRWNGVQLISEEWVREATKKQVENNDNSLGYGYQLWPDARKGSFTYNGMMGQDVKVYPDLDMIIVFNAGDPEVFQDGELDHVIASHMNGVTGFENTEILPANPVEYKNLLELSGRLESGSYYSPYKVSGGWNRRRAVRRYGRRSMYHNWNKPHSSKHDFFTWLSGRTYELEAKTYGLFPITLQTFHNNFTDGISKIGFEYRNHVLYVLFYEGETVQRLSVAFHSQSYSSVNEHGEAYTVGTEGEYTEDEDHDSVLKLRIAFIEEASSRLVTVHFNADTIQVEMDEIPGKLLIVDGLRFSVAGIMESNRWLNNSFGRGAEKVVSDAVMSTIMPSVAGKLISEEKEARDEEEENKEVIEDESDEA